MEQFQQSTLNAKTRQTELFSLRISEELREEIRTLSQLKKISGASLVRSILIDHILQKRVTTNDLHDNEKDHAEVKRKSDNISSGKVFLENKIIKAISHIVSIDLGIGMSQVLNDIWSYVSNPEFRLNNKKALNRQNLEEAFEDFYTFLQENYNLSERAYLSLELIYLTFISFVYPSEIFSTSELSMRVLYRYENMKGRDAYLNLLSDLKQS